ncbi:MAG: hypothetical protein ACO32I_07765, partial [Candidatus Limnocylindrus sp.]
YTGALSQKLKEQEEELKELRARRANNMAATRLLNLEKRRNAVLSKQSEELRQSIRTNWGRDTLERAEAAAEVPFLQAQIVSLKCSLVDAEAECNELRRIVCPPKPMESGAYDMKYRFTIMKLIACANVCHTRVSEVMAITASHWGIVMPGRYRKVLASVKAGVRTYETKWLTWNPCANTCENIR